MARLRHLKPGDRVVWNGCVTRVEGTIEAVFFNWQNHTWYARLRDDRTGRLRQKPIYCLEKKV